MPDKVSKERLKLVLKAELAKASNHFGSTNPKVSYFRRLVDAALLDDTYLEVLSSRVREFGGFKDFI